MFDTAGYPLTPDQYSEFNKFYRSHAGVQAIHAAIEEGRSLESVAGWQCTVCEIGMWIIGIGIISLVAVGGALLGPTAGPIVALATYLGISNTAAAAFIAGVIAGGTLTLDKLLGKICEWTGVCGASLENRTLLKWRTCQGLPTRRSQWTQASPPLASPRCNLQRYMALLLGAT
jgi:hypothetical protein